MNASTGHSLYTYKVHYARDPGKIQANLCLNVNLAHNWQLNGVTQPLVATDHPLEWDSGPNHIQITNWGTDAQGKVIYLKNYRSGATGQLHLVGDAFNPNVVGPTDYIDWSNGDQWLNVATTQVEYTWSPQATFRIY